MAKKLLSKKTDINTGNADSFGWKTNEPAGFQSLKTALKAYFETYRSTLRAHPILPLTALKKRTRFEIEEYKALYFTTITHFQHFFEFILKDCLTRINPILATKFDQKGFKNVYLALNGRSCLSSSAESFSIEFSDALDRLLELRKIDPSNAVITEISFLLDRANILKTLNMLRNRIWHKSLFFLQYHNLDLFMGQHILPLVKEVMALPNYTKQGWKHKPLYCKKDPIDEIIHDCNLKRPSFEKIALLKEMGRAAYENPIVMMDKPNSSWFRAFNHDKIMESKTKADAVCREFFYTDVFECPVCGQKTLIKYEFSDWREDRNGNPVDVTIPDKLHCETCSFCIKENIKRLSFIGINDKNFWDEH